MLWFELKKVYAKTANKIVFAGLAVILAIVCFISVSSVEYVDEEGNRSSGIHAASALRERKMEWAGALTNEVLLEVIRQNKSINSSEEYLSSDVQEKNKAYARKQGFLDIREMINCSFGEFREYNYYRADRVTEEEIGLFYENRVAKLKEWLYSEEADDQFSEEEKQFLIAQYEKLEKPLYYEYADGWKALLVYMPSVQMLVVLLTGFLASGIFSNEFQWKADAIFFSTKYGRNKAVMSKVGAGFWLVTGIYWVSALLYSAVVLGILGTEGADCVIQTDLVRWKSFYQITYLEDYLLTIVGGYIGSLFILTLSMLASAKTHSAVLAAAIPFILIFLPSFLSNFSILPDLLGLLPDQLLQIDVALSYFNLYRIGGKIIGTVPIVLAFYTAGYLCLPPALYAVYRRAEAK